MNVQIIKSSIYSRIRRFQGDSYTIHTSTLQCIYTVSQQEAALSQGRILQRHSAAFLYSPTSATVQMLKLHTVRWWDMAIAENHAPRRVKATMIVNMWLFYSA